MIEHPPRWVIASSHSVTLRDGRRAMLRPVAPTDADLMAAFFAALTTREISYFFALDESAARGPALHVGDDPAYRLIVVNDTGTSAVLAYTFLQWRNKEIPTFGICLSQCAQSQGLGRLLLDYFLASATLSGVNRVRLSVHPDNGRALRLYQRAGFHITGEFINAHQHVKQYRMEADLQPPHPNVTGDLVIVPRGGLGVGVAATRVQRALEYCLGTLPLMLDRPPQPSTPALFVVDMAIQESVRVGDVGDVLTNTPKATTSVGRDESGLAVPDERSAWITSLDAAHLLIAGDGPEALDRAVRRYCHLVAASASSADAAVLLSTIQERV